MFPYLSFAGSCFGVVGVSGGQKNVQVKDIYSPEECQKGKILGQKQKIINFNLKRIISMPFMLLGWPLHICLGFRLLLLSTSQRRPATYSPTDQLKPPNRTDSTATR